MINEWKKRDVFKNKDILKTNPSLLTYLAGTRDGIPAVKVFLAGDDKENAELHLREQYPEVSFEVVDVDKKCEEISKNMEHIEKFEQSAQEIDKEARQRVNEVIKRTSEKVFANHSNIIGIEISNVRSENNKMLHELCIALLCLDESIVPYGESPLPKSLGGYPCDIRREFVMFGHGPSNQVLSIGCSIGIPSVELAGSVGFFVKSNNSPGFFKTGFLTAAHVAIEQYDELYEQSSLLSKHSLAKQSHKITHQACVDNNVNIILGEVFESFIGNYGPNRTGIDAAFVKTNHQILGGIPFFIALKHDCVCIFWIKKLS